MLQLHVTDDRGAVTAHRAEQFPFVIGRSSESDLQISSAGVFDQHARIELALDQSDSEAKFYLHAIGQSLLLVNGEPIAARRLVIGDEISFGATRALVSLSPAAQSALGLHESLVWSLLILVVIAEALVIHFAR
jgi:pSer/pThr/pTyr-binding forkhead associated (FHA) protein